MKIIRTPRAMTAAMTALQRRGRSVGFVPTMGALHDGHLSLVRAARKRASDVAVSIFVNPTQFGPREDLAKYPRPFARDCRLLREAGVRYLYAPPPGAVYPAGHETYVVQERLPARLCGAVRPGHFRGVLTVVLKLFQVVRPDLAFFGQKDYQQSVVIRRMVKDLDLPVKVVVCPIVREPDGLAMSSRNVYLSAEERAQAPTLHAALRLGRAAIRAGERSPRKVLGAMRAILAAIPGASIDYVSAVHPDTLEDVRTLRPPLVLLVAVRIGRTRLIDNWIVR